ncbi:DUF6340 family protein [Ulvibacterium sp.]|uniref:DUF6340 family protein n=1 Tax=Ulvibacterium sp. TaxID=2665914 RepID=UPI00261A33E8|nr:DUF6340 family protein [Ulvibacterium sp.]
MKNPNLLAIGFGLALLISSCSATNQLTMGALEPAPVHLPKEVVNIGIIDRSAPSEGNRTLDKIDKILSAEGLELDKKGAHAAVTALKEELERHDSFGKVEILSDTDVSKGLGVFPASLSWEKIESLCAIHHVDAIFSLAFYDTDTKASYNMTTMQLPNSLGIEVPIPAHEVHLRTLIKNGWRIYYPSERRIVDQFVFNEGLTSMGRGLNPIKAVEAIANRNEGVVELSKNMGSSYALRLLPFRIRISRDYYVRGTDNFIIARRRAQTGDWDGAAELWEKEINNPNRKIAGRAHYNMAIINEINGNLVEAMDWASKSYADYRDRNALRYLNVLKYRFAQNEALEQQVSR